MERRLSGKVMPTIKETSNAVDVFEAISKMDLFSDEKALLFLVTQLRSTTNKQNIINELKAIKESGRIYPKMTNSQLIQSSLKEIELVELDKLSQDLIDKLDKYEKEEIA